MNRRQLFGLLGATAAGSVAAAVPETRKPVAFMCGSVQCAECGHVLFLERPSNGSLERLIAKCENQWGQCPNLGVEVEVLPLPVYARE